MSTQELLSAALQLSDEERLDLATQILESVPGPVDDLPVDDDEFYEELQRRSRDTAGRVRAEDLMERMKSCREFDQELLQRSDDWEGAVRAEGI